MFLAHLLGGLVAHRSLVGLVGLLAPLLGSLSCQGSHGPGEVERTHKQQTLFLFVSFQPFVDCSKPLSKPISPF